MTVEPIERTRQKNFLWLFEQFKEETRKQWPDQADYGMLKMFAERLGMSQLYVSQIKNGGPKEEGGNGRVIGTKLANKIEQALGLPDGWMDTRHDAEPARKLQTAPDVAGEDEGLKDVLDMVSGLYSHSPDATRAALIKVMGAIVTGKPIKPASR